VVTHDRTGRSVTPADARRAAAGRRRSVRARIGRVLTWYLFLAPAVLLLLALLAYPLIDTIRLAFFEWGGLGPQQFVGLENFQSLVGDDTFWIALRNTFAFAIVVPFGTVLLGFLLAVAISRRLRGWPVYRIAFFIPVMMSGVVVATLWTRMYEFTYGLLNVVLRGIGLGFLAQVWLGDPGTALWSIILVPIWQFMGFPMIVLLAAIEGIPDDLHDAATVDGVSELQRMGQLILPLTKPVLAAVTMLQIIGAMKVFDLVLVMTKGGPSFSTEVLGYYLWETAFSSGRFGYGSAIAVVMFGLIFVLAYAYQRGVKLEHVEF
jgi:raffinose/stachyose/melibiose transport system permease protein